MAIPISFEEENIIIDTPDGADPDAFPPVPALRMKTEGMTDSRIEKYATVTCWKLTQPELSEILRTKRLYMVQFGDKLAPTFISGIKELIIEPPEPPEKTQTCVINISRCNKIKDYVPITRGTIWGNPFIIGVHGDREFCLEMFERDLRQRLINEPGLKEELLKLDGKILGCVCTPLPCHGDILVSLIEELKTAPQ